jgi:hypothetical protein
VLVIHEAGQRLAVRFIADMPSREPGQFGDRSPRAGLGHFME